MIIIKEQIFLFSLCFFFQNDGFLHYKMHDKTGTGYRKPGKCMYLPHPYVKTRPDPKVWGVKKFTDRYIKIYAKTLPGEGIEKGKKRKKEKKRKKRKRRKRKRKSEKNRKKKKRNNFIAEILCLGETGL